MAGINQYQRPKFQSRRTAGRETARVRFKARPNLQTRAKCRHGGVSLLEADRFVNGGVSLGQSLPGPLRCKKFEKEASLLLLQAIKSAGSGGYGNAEIWAIGDGTPQGGVPENRRREAIGLLQLTGVATLRPTDDDLCALLRDDESRRRSIGQDGQKGARASRAAAEVADHYTQGGVVLTASGGEVIALIGCPGNG